MGGISRHREQVRETLSRGVRHMEWIPSKLRSIVSAKYGLLMAFVLVCSCFLVLQLGNSRSLFSVVEEGFDCSPLPAQNAPQDPGRGLVESIRRARRAAAGTVNDFPLKGLSSESLNAWNGRHPCQSRRPNGLLSLYTNRTVPAENLPANALWDEVFEEYSNLHRECLQQVGDIGDYFLEQNTSSGCKFVVADVSDKAEFGDKMLVLASSLLFAILTQRVILIPGSTLVPSYMCEPFAGSSWLLESSSFPGRPSSSGQLWKLDREIFSGLDWHRSRCSSSRSAPESPYAAGIATNQWQPEQRFYCTDEQTVFSKSTFVYLSGFVYTIPKLFATPVFRPALEALFPDRIVLTRLLRSAFLPGNPVWKRVKGLHEGYLRPTDRLVGIEVRYHGNGMPRYKTMSEILNSRITDCLVQNDMLPSVANTWEAHDLPRPSPTPVFRVLISSVFLGLKDHLSWMYERSPSSTGVAVGVVQMSQSETEEFSVEADVEAFKEALLLSFSDQLLITPKSTLGSVAHAYGALVPWFVDVRQNGWFTKYGTCQQGKTIEVCNHFTEKKYSCLSDSSVDGKFMADVVPYLKNCVTTDHEDGIQLITGSRS